MKEPRRQGNSWRLTGYVLREITKTFVFVLAILELAYSLLIAIGVAQAAKLELTLVLPVVWFVAAGMLADAIPLALVFGVSLAYGRFIADRESMAFRSFGLSYRQLLVPAMIAGVVMSVATYFAGAWIGPEMSHQRRDVGRLLVKQFRYLGEGWNRDFSIRGSPFNFWLRHHDGRQLEGIFLSPKSNLVEDPLFAVKAGESGAPERWYIYAERGRVLFPDELEAEGISVEGLDEIDLDTTIIVELRGISLFFSDPASNSRFLQRAFLAERHLPFPFGGQGTRRGKDLTNAGLNERIEETRDKLASEELTEPERAEASEELLKLKTEYHKRWAQTLACFLFAVVAGLIALWMNSDNRLLPFFVSSTVLPALFYGTKAIAAVLAEHGLPPAVALYASPVVLSVAGAVGYFLLEKRVLR